MKRSAVVLVLALLFGGLALAGEAATVLKVKVATANIRSEPDINAAVVRQLAAGTLLEAEQMVGDWWEVQVTDKSGNAVTAYIHANVVDVVGGDEPMPEETQPVRRPQPAPTQAPVYREYETAPYYPGGFKLLGGYGMASLKTSAEEEDEFNEYKTTLNGIAGGLGYEGGGQIGFELDFMYMPKGIRYKGTQQEGDVEYKFDMKMRITEISAIALLKFNLPVQGLNPFLVGGGEIGYVIGAKYDYEYSADGESESGSEDIKEDTKDIDYGLVFGGGLGFDLSGMSLQAQVRYHLGLANLVDPGDEETDETVKSSMFMILLGIKF